MKTININTENGIKFTLSPYNQPHVNINNIEDGDAVKVICSITNVRLQWHPDHNPHDNKLERKAIQIGMNEDILKSFWNDWIVKIEDVTSFVKSEYQKVLNNQLDDLNVSVENMIELDHGHIIK